MYQRIDKEDFIRLFNESYRADSFSHEALVGIFDYLEEAETDAPGVELDIIAICCAFTEYSSLAEALAEYRTEDVWALGGMIHLSGGGVVIHDG